MATSKGANRQELTTQLAGVRQSVALLKSQLRSGNIERDYFEARLDDIGNLLEILTEERNASNNASRVAALYEVSRALGSSLDINEVLNQVMDAIIQLTGAERGFLMLFDDQGELEMKAARNLDKESLAASEFIFSRSVIRTVAETGDQVVTTDAAEDPRFKGQASVVAHNLRSIQCVPLRARNRIIGVIYVDNRIRKGVFDERDLEMLAAFAAQAAIAIENARLFTLTDEQLAIKVEELERMQAIDRELNEHLDFSRAMNTTLDWAVRVTGADNGAIGVIDLEEGSTRIIAEYGKTPARAKSMIAGEGSADNLGLTMPIQREGRVIGLIALARDSKQPFSNEAQSFVLRLADHAAIAIENAQLYEQVRRANQAKSEFVSVMAHELRVPMTSIRGYADMIGMVGTLSDQQAGFLRIIRSNVERMGLLVSDLADIARIEAGKLSVEPEANVRLEAVINDVVLSLQAEIDRREHKVVMEMPADLPAVMVDPKRLTQVLVNLISNAYKYTPNGGTITLRARRNGSMVRCDVEDTGVGMTEEELEKLFTKFWRAEDIYVREQPGTGLGLAIAKNLVELQGGQMEVRSSKGKGTTFGFTMPVSA